MKKAISGLSCNIVIDSRVNPAGLSKVLFRIKEKRVKRDIYTRIRWPREFFDAKNQQLMPRQKDDPDCVPFNLRINEYKAVAHRIQLSGYLKDSSVTIDDLVKEFNEIGKGDDFFTFMEARAKELYNDSIIVYGTWNRHKSTLTTFKTYYKHPALPVNKIDLEFIQKFDAWAKRVHKRSHNTVCGYHKDIKKYLGIALRKCLISRNPYDDFSFKYVDGDRQALTKEEIKRLYDLLINPKLSYNEREICRRYLFSCVTGLRISDTDLVHENMIKDNHLCFVPYKGREKGKMLRVPLSGIAKSLIEGRKGMLFVKFSHGYINETLKILAARADIFKRMPSHSARDTFGTHYIEMNGDVKSLSEIMGHSSTKTTMIYVKMTDKRKQDLMNNFDDLFGLNDNSGNK
jgi:integrase/recombinase XerD